MGRLLSRPESEALRALPAPLRCPDSELLKAAFVEKLPASFLSFSEEKDFICAQRKKAEEPRLLPLKTSGMT